MLHMEPVLDVSTKFTFVMLCIGGFTALIWLVLQYVPDDNEGFANSPAMAALRAYGSGSDPKIIKEALEMVGKKMKIPLYQVKIYWESFKNYDKNGSGSVDSGELKKMLMDTIGFCPSDADIESIIRDVDADGNGTVDFLEFCSLVKQVDLGEQTEEELRDAFLLWSNGKERIPRSELVTAMTKLGDKLTEEEFNEFMSDADVDSDGTIDYSEYKRALQWGKPDKN